MKYMIVKEVHGLRYYWNKDNQTWYGFSDNATKFKIKQEAETEIKNLGIGYVLPTYKK